MKKKRFAIIITGMFFVMVLCGLAGAKEPQIPDVAKAFGPDKEKRMKEMKKLEVSECFEELKELEFLLDNDYLHKAAYRCFNHRKAEAIEYAIAQLNQPAYRVEGEMLILNYNLYSAKAVLRVFAVQAEGILAKEYRSGSAETRAKILYAMGLMAGKKSKELLVEALYDQTVYEETYPEMEGIPLRVCDMAYNQLRLRYADELEDLPRTIANVHRIETRDSYINEMADRF